MDKSTKPKHTCRQSLEAQGVIIYSINPSEFVAYRRSTPEGSVDFDHDIESILENIGFHDYEEVARGKGLYVMGDVESDLDDSRTSEVERKLSSRVEKTG